MERKITIAILILLTISVGYIWLKEDKPNYEYLKAEHIRIRTELKELGETLKTQDNEITRLKNEMVKSDSIIDGADNGQLNDLFTDFFDRTRHDKMFFNIRR